MALGLWLIMELPLTYPDLSPCYSALSPLLQPHQSLCFPSNPNVLSGAPGPLCFLLPQPEATPSPTKVGFPTVVCKVPFLLAFTKPHPPNDIFPLSGKNFKLFFPPIAFVILCKFAPNVTSFSVPLLACWD